MKNSSISGVVILAAGLGKRMHSALPKVLNEVGGKPLIFHILQRLQQTLPKIPIAVVVGHGREAVEAFIRAEPLFRDLALQFIVQPEQRGTGHAARCAMDSDWGQARVREKGAILVLPGDFPLISGALLEQITQPLKSKEGVRLLTCELSDPYGYGRVIRRGARGAVLRIVEEKDLKGAREAAVREVAVSIYLFQAEFFQIALRKLSQNNAQGEYYLTDVIGQAVRAKKQIPVLIWKNTEDLRGINDPWELAQAARVVNERTVRAWAQKGVRFLDSESVRIDVTVQLSQGVVLHPGVILRGQTQIQAGAEIGPRVVLKDVQVGEGAYLKTGTVAEEAVVGAQAQIGPYAHLRPHSRIGARVKIGNFVETKNSVIHEDTSIAHLSYVGDAVVGRNVNIGCGFITCNFDGRIIDGKRKHQTIVEDDVFLGSDCQVVAPIKIGQGAYVASGSTLTQDVPPHDLAIARARQINKAGYAKTLRQKK